MKKTGIILSAVLVLIIVVGLSLSLFLNKAVKSGVETIGPKITKTSITVDAVDISIISGSGEIKGLVLGNPQGYKTDYAMKLGRVRIALDPQSIWSDRVIINEIVVDSPVITYETALTENNISKIMKNIESSTARGSSKRKAPAGGKREGKKMQINDLRINNGKINLSSKVMQGKAITLPLQDIHLTGIGAKSGGASVPEVAEKVFRSVNGGIMTAVTQSGQKFTEGVDSVKKTGEAVKEEASGFMKGLKDVFKKDGN